MSLVTVHLVYIHLGAALHVYDCQDEFDSRLSLLCDIPAVII